MGKKHRGGSKGEMKAKQRRKLKRTTYGDEPIFSCNLKKQKREEKMEAAMENAKKENERMQALEKELNPSDDESSEEEQEEVRVPVFNRLVAGLCSRPIENPFVAPEQAEAPAEAPAGDAEKGKTGRACGDSEAGAAQRGECAGSAKSYTLADASTITLMEPEELDASDPYVRHFEREFESEPDPPQMSNLEDLGILSMLGDTISSTEKAAPAADFKLSDYHVKPRLIESWQKDPKRNEMSPLLPLLLGYQDVLWTARKPQNTKATYDALSLHIVNHILKSRDLQLKNDARAKAATAAGESTEFRDQGFTKAKALVLLPMKGRAMSFIESILAAAPRNLQEVENKAKFIAEYGEEEDAEQIHPSKPNDYK